MILKKNQFTNFTNSITGKTIFRKIDINIIVTRATDFYKMSSKNEINLKFKKNKNYINGDEEQLYRVFINLIKNSEDSISEKKEKDELFKGKINIEIDDNKDYIKVTLVDNGVGIEKKTKIMTPYFTTKKNGTGLGLPIVSKIINEHKGELIINNSYPGAKVLVSLPKN